MSLEGYQFLLLAEMHARHLSLLAAQAPCTAGIVLLAPTRPQSLEGLVRIHFVHYNVWITLTRL